MRNHKKPVYRIDPKTEEVVKYDSVAEAADAVYGNRYAINIAIEKGSQSYGYLWKSSL